MATLYVSPLGAGDRSGSSWADAALLTSLDRLVQQAGPGGQVLLRADAGEYAVTDQIAIMHGGSTGKPVTIRGVDARGGDMHAVITGTRPAQYAGDTDAGNELFKLLDGADNLKFTDLTVRDTGSVFRIGADIERITIDDVDATNVARFLQDMRSGEADSATISRLTIRNVEVTGFSKVAITLQDDSNTVKIENVRLDAGGQTGDPYLTGIHLDGTAHDVTIRKTSAANAQTVGKAGAYWNGDGFATERGVHDVQFVDTIARGNSDGGYDLKSTGTTLTRALAEDNGRNFRLWGDIDLIDPTGLDPHVRGGKGAQVQVWVAEGADVSISGGVFRDASAATTVFAGANAAIRFDDVAVYRSPLSHFTSFRGMTVDGLGEIVDHVLYQGMSTGFDWP